jgi:predicted RNA-binding Zn ribbon-like protein
VLTVALAAAQLLTSPEAATVSACPGRDCGWLFLDRRGRRRWCSMDSCGNRAKVAAHARRQRGRGTG